MVSIAEFEVFLFFCYTLIGPILTKKMVKIRFFQLFFRLVNWNCLIFGTKVSLGLHIGIFEIVLKNFNPSNPL